MEKNTKPITNDCSMAGIKPAVLPMPYPPIQAWCRNPGYAAILTNDYCGAVSELSPASPARPLLPDTCVISWKVRSPLL